MTRDFQTFLKQYYTERAEKNPRFSMRALAKSLDMDQSLLIKITNCKRSPSKQMILKIGKKLNLSSAQIDQFIEEALKNKETKFGFFTNKYKRIEELDFEIISDWYHFAILELLQVPDTSTKPIAIAKKLGLTTDEVKNALDRLIERGLIIQNELGLALSSKNNTWSNAKSTTVARKNLQKKLLLKSRECVDTVPLELRENASLTIAFNPAKIEQVKKLIQGFKNQLLAFSEKNSNYKEVYQLVVGFYPLTKNGES